MACVSTLVPSLPPAASAAPASHGLREYSSTLPSARRRSVSTPVPGHAVRSVLLACTACGAALGLPTRLGPPGPHLHQDRLVPHRAHLHRDWARPYNSCIETGLAPATSAPGLGPPLPHLHRDWASRLFLAPQLADGKARIALHCIALHCPSADARPFALETLCTCAGCGASSPTGSRRCVTHRTAGNKRTS